VVPEPGQQDAAKWRVNSWSLRTKVAVVLVVPAVVALALGGLRVQGKLDEANRLSTVRDQLAVVGEALTLADLVALEMVAAVPPDTTARAQREDAVDTQVTRLRNAADFAELPADVNRKLSDALDQLDEARTQAASDKTDPVTEAFAYREVIGDLGELLPRIVSFTRVEDLDDRAANVLSMLLLRAALAGEEALIASGKGSAVSNDVAASVQHSAAEEAVLGQQLSLDIPAVDLPEFVSATRTWSPRRDAIQAAIAKGRTAELARLVPDLQTEQTALRGLIEQKYGELVDTVDARTNQARSDALRDAAIVLGALLAALAVALTVARSLLLPVRKLRAAALSVAHDKLPATVERVRAGDHVDWRTVEPVAVRTDEEIGQLARAFDDMHQQAVRLAGEQAELRHQVSEMFMTLSRRSQSLVELQLGVIEGLEADEHDPRRLEGLFRLDHLATRLRRNGENLQVLAGGTPPKRGNRPVPVVELLRAATSEVKDYRRVSLGHAPNASVRSSAATDVVHIVAELLENATRYSPPDRKVVLTADRGTDGGLLLEVIDTGLGMADDDLETANDRLDAADAVGPETTRRMGLFVVSLLAARHGVTVRLRPTYERAKQAGITASVHVPGALVLSAGVPGVPAAQAERPAVYATGEVVEVTDDDGEITQIVRVQSGLTDLPARQRGPGRSDDGDDARETDDPEAAVSGEIVRPERPGETTEDRLRAVPPPVPVVPEPVNGTEIGWFTPVLEPSPEAPVTPTNGHGTTERGWLTPATPIPTPQAPAEPPFTPGHPANGTATATNGTAGATKNVADPDPPTLRTTAAGLPVRTPRTAASGLPVRTPGARTGPATKPATEPADEEARKPGAGFRDPDAIRANLSRHYGGVQAARRARKESDEPAESTPDRKN
jgi:signal transduction histidine kinase